MDSNGHKKILVVQTSFLGDVVLTTPLISEVRRRFPRAELAVLCTPAAKNLLEGNPNIDALLTDDKRGEGRGWRGLWRKAKELRDRGFTLALSPHKSFRTALLLFLAKIPCRIGFRQSAGWFLYHRCVERDPGRHDVERNLSVLKPLGIDPGDCHRDLCVEGSGAAREAVERLFRSLGIKKDGPIFGINPGSVWPTKRWSPQGYAELMRLLKEKHDATLLLFGGPEDCGIVEEIQRLCGHIGIDLAGKIALGELPAALERCDLLVTNDSGPMHVAVARGVPVAAIFCATTPSLGFYPYSARAVVIEKELPCRPCASHGGRRCPLGTEDCMRLIQATDVLRAVEGLLNGEVEAGKEPYLPQSMTL